MSVDPRAVLDRPAPPPDATLRYGPLPEHVADLRLPVGGATAGRPLVVVIHGGFWRAEYDRGHTGPLAAALADLGYPVAQLEYRCTGQPGGGWPATFEDVAAGVAALPDLVAAYTGEPVGEPILLGHSAGGQLALWLTSAGRADPTVRPVAGVLALAPVADLVAAHRLDLDSGAVAALLGGGPAEFADRYAATDPTLLVPPQSPTVVIHGTLDQQVPVRLGRDYVRAAHAVGGEIRFVELAKCEHFGLIDPLSEAWPQVVAALGSLHDDLRGIDAASSNG